MTNSLVSLVDAAGPKAIVSERLEADGRKTVTITVPSPSAKQIWIGNAVRKGK